MWRFRKIFPVENGDHFSGAGLAKFRKPYCCYAFLYCLNYCTKHVFFHQLVFYCSKDKYITVRI